MRVILVLVLLLAGCGASQAPALPPELESEVQKRLQIDRTAQEKEAGVMVPLVGQMSDADEQALGREIAGRLLAAYPLVKNDPLQQYVNRVGRNVAAQSMRPSLNWTFGVIATEDINAFAAPGGYVFLTAGLYRMLENEAALASVLGHEIAHVNERHHVRLLQKARLMAVGQDLLLGKAKSESVKKVAGTGLELYARSLDKEAEFFSDRLGIQYAARAGYDPFAYVAVLDRMGSIQQADKLSLLYKTHPNPSERLDALEKLIGGHWDALESRAAPKRWVPIE